jgi:hypothetical protein
MVHALKKCAICSAAITSPFFVCADCVRKYGLGPNWREWPAWAKQLCVDHNRWRRSERRQLANESHTEGAVAYYNMLCYGDYNDDGV